MDEYKKMPPTREIVICRNCHVPGHIVKECPKVMCRRCGRLGHFRDACPLEVTVAELHPLGGSSSGFHRSSGPKRARSEDEHSNSPGDVLYREGNAGCFNCGSTRHMRSQCPMQRRPVSPNHSDSPPHHSARSRSDSPSHRGYPSHTSASFTLLKCFNCGHEGHLKANCPRPSNQNRCFHCFESGHLSNRCPYRSEMGDVRLCYFCHLPGHMAGRCPQKTTATGGSSEHPSDSMYRSFPMRDVEDTGLPELRDRDADTATAGSEPLTGGLIEDTANPAAAPQAAPEEGTPNGSSEAPSTTPGQAQQPRLSPPVTPTTANPAASAAQSNSFPSSARSTAVGSVPMVPPFEPQAVSLKRGRLAVVIDGSYFERCIVVGPGNRRDMSSYTRCKELLKYTLDLLGDIFEMNPIAYWFDTDPNIFATFVENHCNLGIRESVLRESDVRRRLLTDAMNGGKELPNVVAKLVGGMKRQKGFTDSGMGAGSVWVQTGVDVSIATCVIECFQDRRQFQQVVLLSGDSDLYPCVHYCNSSRRSLPPDVPPVRVCGTTTTISKVFGQHQDLSDFLPRILLDEATHREGERLVQNRVANFFRQ